MKVLVINSSTLMSLYAPLYALHNGVRLAMTSTTVDTAQLTLRNAADIVDHLQVCVVRVQLCLARLSLLDGPQDQSYSAHCEDA